MKIMFRRAWDQTRLRIVGAFFTIVLVCVPLTVLVWGFDYIDELRVRIFMSAAAGAMLILMVLSEPKSWRERWESLSLSVVLYPLLIFAIAHEFDITSLMMNAVVAFVAIPCCWVVWVSMGRDWLLRLATMLAVIAAMFHWGVIMIATKVPLDVALLPLPALLLIGALWAPLARMALYFARRWKYRRLRGPGSQAVAMVAVFSPIFVIAIAVPQLFELGPIWLAVSLALAGILLGTVISEPLRRFLLRLGNLSPDE